MLTALGYNVITKINPLSAVEYYRDNMDQVDLVILDLVMPKMGGREVFLALKELNPRVKAVLSTGHGRNGAAEELLKEGMVGFVEKPYLIDQLSEAVAKAMA
jgi:DNA-binding NtrC family response regulator